MRAHVQACKCMDGPQNAGKQASEHPFYTKIYWGVHVDSPLPLAGAANAAASSGLPTYFERPHSLPQILDHPLQPPFHRNLDPPLPWL